MCGICIAQDKKIEKAESNYDNYNYVTAIDSYEKLVKKGYSDQQIYRNLGDANYQNAEYSEASNWYNKLLELENVDVEPEYMYKYAQALKSTGDYTTSEIWMNKYKDASGSEVRAIKIAEEADYLQKIEERSGTFEIKNLDINSKQSDFAPSFNERDLIFSTSRDSGITTTNIHLWNGESFTNLYKTTENENGEFERPTKLSKIFNKKTHESSTAYTKDGSTVYFTRNNSDNGRFSRDEQGVSRLKIYRASLENGDWTNITELPFNDDAHSVAHPTLSPDESKLYFASDMQGTNGQSDIFVVDINSDGSFGTPKNLGTGINTESRETFPFVTKDNILYFASDGHPGLGGLDVFAINLEYPEKAKVVNVGKAVNSKQDDFSFIINPDTKRGFFASNRDGGKGSDDIYSFEQTKELDLDCHTLVTGLVKDKLTGEPIGSAKLIVTNAEGEQVAEAISDNEGNFNMLGDCSDGNYSILGSKIEYSNGEETFAISGANDISGINVLLDPIKKSAPVGTDLAKYLNIEPIYFDFDKWNIRQDASVSILKVINYMKEYKNVKVQVQSHTDSRGNDQYNESLSQRRADSTIAHMIANGIEASRIMSEGYGEKQLTNDCSNQVSCSEEKHQVNRRSEFLVVE